MKVSAKSEYACIAMMELAANYRAGQPTRIKAIAEAHGINSGFLVQILLQLKNAGLGASVRAAQRAVISSPSSPKTSPWLTYSTASRTATRRVGLGNDALRRRSRLANRLGDIQAEEQRLLEGLSLAEIWPRPAEPAADLTYQI